MSMLIQNYGSPLRSFHVVCGEHMRLASHS